MGNDLCFLYQIFFLNSIIVLLPPDHGTMKSSFYDSSTLAPPLHHPCATL